LNNRLLVLGVFQALRYSCLAQSNFWKRVQRASQVAFARFQKWALRFAKLPLQALTQYACILPSKINGIGIYLFTNLSLRKNLPSITTINSKVCGASDLSSCMVCVWLSLSSASRSPICSILPSKLLMKYRASLA
jgi:hypothetical protein